MIQSRPSFSILNRALACWCLLVVSLWLIILSSSVHGQAAAVSVHSQLMYDPMRSTWEWKETDWLGHENVSLVYVDPSSSLLNNETLPGIVMDGNVSLSITSYFFEQGSDLWIYLNDNNSTFNRIRLDMNFTLVNPLQDQIIFSSPSLSLLWSNSTPMVYLSIDDQLVIVDSQLVEGFSNISDLVVFQFSMILSKQEETVSSCSLVSLKLGDEEKMVMNKVINSLSNSSFDLVLTNISPLLLGQQSNNSTPNLPPMEGKVLNLTLVVSYAADLLPDCQNTTKITNETQKNDSTSNPTVANNNTTSLQNGTDNTVNDDNNNTLAMNGTILNNSSIDGNTTFNSSNVDNSTITENNSSQSSINVSSSTNTTNPPNSTDSVLVNQPTVNTKTIANHSVSSFSCFGYDPQDPKVCNGIGICAYQDVCVCSDKLSRYYLLPDCSPDILTGTITWFEQVNSLSMAPVAMNVTTMSSTTSHCYLSADGYCHRPGTYSSSESGADTLIVDSGKIGYSAQILLDSHLSSGALCSSVKGLVEDPRCEFDWFRREEFIDTYWDGEDDSGGDSGDIDNLNRRIYGSSIMYMRNNQASNAIVCHKCKVDSASMLSRRRMAIRFYFTNSDAESKCYVENKNIPNMLFNDFTFNIWLLIENIGNEMTLVDFSTTTKWKLALTNDTKLVLTTYGSSTYPFGQSASSATFIIDRQLSTNIFYLVSITKSSDSGLSVYINGELVKRDESHLLDWRQIGYIAYPNTIGRDANINEHHFIGLIERVEIHRRVFSSSEIKYVFRDYNHSCYGISNLNQSVCGSNGDCVSTDKCVCDDGYIGDDCSILLACFGKKPNESGVCGGNGQCLAPDACSCNSGWVGKDCTLRKRSKNEPSCTQPENLFYDFKFGLDYKTRKLAINPNDVVPTLTLTKKKLSTCGFMVSYNKYSIVEINTLKNLTAKHINLDNYITKLVSYAEYENYFTFLVDATLSINSLRTPNLFIHNIDGNLVISKRIDTLTRISRILSDGKILAILSLAEEGKLEIYNFNLLDLNKAPIVNVVTHNLLNENTLREGDVVTTTGKILHYMSTSTLLGANRELVLVLTIDSLSANLSSIFIETPKDSLKMFYNSENSNYLLSVGSDNSTLYSLRDTTLTAINNENSFVKDAGTRFFKTIKSIVASRSEGSSISLSSTMFSSQFLINPTYLPNLKVKHLQNDGCLQEYQGINCQYCNNITCSGTVVEIPFLGMKNKMLTLDIFTTDVSCGFNYKHNQANITSIKIPITLNKLNTQSIISRYTKIYGGNGNYFIHVTGEITNSSKLFQIRNSTVEQLIATPKLLGKAFHISETNVLFTLLDEEFLSLHLVNNNTQNILDLGRWERRGLNEGNFEKATFSERESNFYISFITANTSQTVYYQIWTDLNLANITETPLDLYTNLQNDYCLSGKDDRIFLTIVDSSGTNIFEIDSKTQITNIFHVHLFNEVRSSFSLCNGNTVLFWNKNKSLLLEISEENIYPQVDVMFNSYIPVVEESLVQYIVPSLSSNYTSLFKNYKLRLDNTTLYLDTYIRDIYREIGLLESRKLTELIIPQYVSRRYISLNDILNDYLSLSLVEENTHTLAIDRSLTQSLVVNLLLIDNQNAFHKSAYGNDTNIIPHMNNLVPTPHAWYTTELRETTLQVFEVNPISGHVDIFTTIDLVNVTYCHGDQLIVKNKTVGELTFILKCQNSETLFIKSLTLSLVSKIGYPHEITLHSIEKGVYYELLMDNYFKEDYLIVSKADSSSIYKLNFDASYTNLLAKDTLLSTGDFVLESPPLIIKSLGKRQIVNSMDKTSLVIDVSSSKLFDFVMYSSGNVTREFTSDESSVVPCMNGYYGRYCEYLYLERNCSTLITKDYILSYNRETNMVSLEKYSVDLGCLHRTLETAINVTMIKPELLIKYSNIEAGVNDVVHFREFENNQTLIMVQQEPNNIQIFRYVNDSYALTTISLPTSTRIFGQLPDYWLAASIVGEKLNLYKIDISSSNTINFFSTKTNQSLYYADLLKSTSKIEADGFVKLVIPAFRDEGTTLVSIFLSPNQEILDLSVHKIHYKFTLAKLLDTESLILISETVSTLFRFNSLVNNWVLSDEVSGFYLTKGEPISVLNEGNTTYILKKSNNDMLMVDQFLSIIEDVAVSVSNYSWNFEHFDYQTFVNATTNTTTTNSTNTNSTAMDNTNNNTLADNTTTNSTTITDNNTTTTENSTASSNATEFLNITETVTNNSNSTNTSNETQLFNGTDRNSNNTTPINTTISDTTNSTTTNTSSVNYNITTDTNINTTITTITNNTTTNTTDTMNTTTTNTTYTNSIKITNNNTVADNITSNNTTIQGNNTTTVNSTTIFNRTEILNVTEAINRNSTNTTTYTQTYCFGLNSKDPMVCSGHGECVRHNQCECNVNHNGPYCQYPICFGFSANESSLVCSGNGVCSLPNTCNCASGYRGFKCHITQIVNECTGSFVKAYELNVVNGSLVYNMLYLDSLCGSTIVRHTWVLYDVIPKATLDILTPTTITNHVADFRNGTIIYFILDPQVFPPNSVKNDVIIMKILTLDETLTRASDVELMFTSDAYNTTLFRYVDKILVNKRGQLFGLISGQEDTVLVYIDIDRRHVEIVEIIDFKTTRYNINKGNYVYTNGTTRYIFEGTSDRVVISVLLELLDEDRSLSKIITLPDNSKDALNIIVCNPGTNSQFLLEVSDNGTVINNIYPNIESENIQYIFLGENDQFFVEKNDTVIVKSETIADTLVTYIINEEKDIALIVDSEKLTTGDPFASMKLDAPMQVRYIADTTQTVSWKPRIDSISQLIVMYKPSTIDVGGSGLQLSDSQTLISFYYGSTEMFASPLLTTSKQNRFYLDSPAIQDKFGDDIIEATPKITFIDSFMKQIFIPVPIPVYFYSNIIRKVVPSVVCPGERVYITSGFVQVPTLAVNIKTLNDNSKTIPLNMVTRHQAWFEMPKIVGMEYGKINLSITIDGSLYSSPYSIGYRTTPNELKLLTTPLPPYLEDKVGEPITNIISSPDGEALLFKMKNGFCTNQTRIVRQYVSSPKKYSLSDKYVEIEFMVSDFNRETSGNLIELWMHNALTSVAVLVSRKYSSTSLFLQQNQINNEVTCQFNPATLYQLRLKLDEETHLLSANLNNTQSGVSCQVTMSKNLNYTANMTLSIGQSYNCQTPPFYNNITVTNLLALPIRTQTISLPNQDLGWEAILGISLAGLALFICAGLVALLALYEYYRRKKRSSGRFVYYDNENKDRTLADLFHVINESSNDGTSNSGDSLMEVEETNFAKWI